MRPVSLRAHLLALTLVTLLPMLLLGGILIGWLADKQQESVERGLLESTKALALAVDREIEANFAALEGLAAADSLVAGDLHATYEKLQLALRQHPYWANVALLDPSGQQLLHTAKPVGAELPNVGHFDFVRRAIDTGKPVVSDLIQGPVAGRLNIAILLPVMRDGRLAHVLAAVINPEAWSAVLAEFSSDPGAIVAADDNRHRILARNRDALTFLGREAPAWAVAARGESNSGIGRGISLQGIPIVAGFYRSAKSGWTLVIARPQDEVDAPVQRTVLLASSFGLTLLLASLALAVAAARGISRPMAALAAAGQELALQKPIAVPEAPTRIKELARLWSNLAGASGELIGATREVAELNAKLEKRVEERTARLRTMSQAVEHSPDIVMITDATGRIEYVNPTFEDTTGFAAEYAVGLTPAIIRSEATPRAVHEEMWKAIGEGREWRGELQDRRKDGSPFWIDSVIMPVRDDEGAVVNFVAMSRDITERKLAEIELVHAKEQAELANKAKSEIMANMSHELRTPLNAIIGYSDALLEGIAGAFANARQKEYVGDIHFSGQHLLALINDILDVAAIEAGMLVLHPEAFEVRASCEACLRLIAPRADKAGLKLEFSPPTDFPRLMADQRRFKQILLNLLSNAVKFTPAGGFVRLSMTLEADGGIAVGVEDSGIGMTRDEIAVALTPFGQVDSSLSRKHDGTGLGLPLTLNLVQLHGGAMRIDSTKGFGTKMVVSFPAERTLVEALL